MVERIRKLMNRFPENEETVRALVRENPHFNALCQEYAEVTQELRRLDENKNPNAISTVQGLKERREAIEEQLLTRIEGYEPV